jgi:hypothetical protein
MNSKVNGKEISKEISKEINKLIIDMKFNNTSPKKIQFDLKRHHSIDITQQQIRDTLYQT